MDLIQKLRDLISRFRNEPEFDKISSLISQLREKISVIEFINETLKNASKVEFETRKVYREKGKIFAVKACKEKYLEIFGIKVSLIEAKNLVEELFPENPNTLITLREKDKELEQIRASYNSLVQTLQMRDREINRLAEESENQSQTIRKLQIEREKNPE